MHKSDLKRTTLATAVMAVLVASVALAQPEDRPWDGDVDSNWDYATLNWTGDAFAADDNAIFDGDGQGPITIQAGGVQTGTFTVNSGDYTFTGGLLETGGVMTLANDAGSTIAFNGMSFERSGDVNVNNNTLNLINTAVTRDGNHRFTVGSGGSMLIDAGAQTVDLWTLDNNGGTVEFRSGTVMASTNTTTVSGLNSEAGTSGVIRYDFTGAAVTVHRFQTNANMTALLEANVESGSLTVNNDVYIRGGAFDHANDPTDPLDRPTHLLTIQEGASMSVSNIFRLGQPAQTSFTDANNFSAGVRLNMTGGELTASSVALGHSINRGGTNFAADGLWNQTGGLASISTMTVQQIVSGSLDIDRGALLFVVGEDATLAFTGSGMAASTTGSGWMLTAERYNLAGTIRFSGDTSTQNFLVFGEEIGTSNTDFASLINTNFAVGTLDLRDLVAQSATLNLLEAENFSTNALYVDSLLMDTPVDPGAFFAGDINLYYNPATSDITGTWAFGTGTGMLIMIPEPGTVLLMAAGGLLLMSRSRRRAMAG